MTVTAITAATQRVTSAIQTAAQRTGIDFDYLLGQAKLESGLNAQARAGTSSATGLYQFIESSWLSVVKKHGAEHGLGWAADSIGRNASGRLTVANGNRAAILALRNNPEVASLMAAEHAGDNKQALEGALGREATGTDLYMAHFLGLGGARQFLGAMQGNPDRSAASLFPAAARANRNVFFERDGSARSLAQVYERFGNKLGGSGAGETAAANRVSFAAQTLSLGMSGADDATVVTGDGQSAADALGWARTALTTTNEKAGSLLRPTPATARLAYMMLAGMGR
ncbi:flagellar biosynthesis protein FlgJ [Sphingomonas sp. Leaf412]|uniref:hypothetical protein n=1 Tax=Sphingomonas sp. Leaf412 TaxID=1736370 RepID=UPI0006FEC696|nr:hypothetical protein [Sphingomonas sp. Leaf412]KQT35125.1 flagellar biosynthesis protein FlgJ [Sphingomonas sp. Leaf412]